MSKNLLKNTIDLRKLLPAYKFPITESLIALDGEKLMFTVRFDGLFHDSFSSATIENYFNSFVTVLNVLGKANKHNLSMWTHLIKEKNNFSDKIVFSDYFMQGFSKQYYESFQNGSFYKVGYYVTFVLKHTNLNDGIDRINEIQSMISSSLKPFNPHILKVVKRNGGDFCENLEFLTKLLTGEDVEIPLLMEITATEYISKLVNIHFGYDISETRLSDSVDSNYSVYYDLNSFPVDSYIGMWDFLLSIKAEFVLTQSMIFISNQQTIKNIDSQINKMTSFNDSSEHQVNELLDAKNYLSSGELVFGDYHVSLKVMGDNQKDVLEKGALLKAEFLSDGNGTSLVRSNLRSIYSMLSMMPDSKNRPLSLPKTSTTIACAFSLHNFSEGKRTGNPIGDGFAIMPLKTISDNIYYYNSHYSDINKNVTGQKIAGHTLIMGATGTGKTTLEAVLVGFSTRFDPMIFAIDYNRSTELFIKAYGGKYFTFENGVKTGINPFQLEITPQTTAFLYSLIECLCRDENGKLKSEEEQVIKEAVDIVIGLDFKSRRISALLQTITDNESIKIRLKKWCGNGKMAWVFDNEVNKFNPKDYNRIGFDTTDFLKDDHPACEPLLATLFYFKTLMQKEGKLMLSIVEEFWKPANFPLTQELIKGVLKAGRLKNEFMFLVSQSPEDAINCEISAAIIQQTPTKIFLPNPDAEFESYRKCGLTEKEFLKLKNLAIESRTFLIKQSKNSVFAKMDLYGFDQWLPVLSGTTETIILAEKIINEVGDNPNDWIPELQRQIEKEK